jgi:hypothetical protein
MWKMPLLLLSVCQQAIQPLLVLGGYLTIALSATLVRARGVYTLAFKIQAVNHQHAKQHKYDR